MISRLAASALAAGLAGAVAAASPAIARPLADVLNSGTLRVCVQEDAAPFSDRAAEKGIFIDLGRDLAAALGVSLGLDWVVSAEYIRKKDCDVIPMVAVIGSDDPIRLSDAWVSVPFVIVSAAGHSPVQGIADLGDGPVAVLAESYARHMLNGRVSLRVAFLRNEEILDAVASRSVAAGVVPLYSFQWYVHVHPDATLRADPADPLLADLGYSAALGERRSDPALRQRIDQTLADMRRNGRFAAIFAKYGLAWQPP